MAITKLNSLAIPDNTIVEADLSYPLTNFSSTGIDDNATNTAITINSNETVDFSIADARFDSNGMNFDRDAYIYSYNGGSVGQVFSGIRAKGSDKSLEFYAGQNLRATIDSAGALGVNKGKVILYNDGDSGYVQSRLILESNAAGRGAGVFCQSKGDSNEWYAGTGYNRSTSYLICHQASSPYNESTADQSRAVLRLDSDNTVWAPDVYSRAVSGRDVYVRSDGLLGYLSSTRESKDNIQSLSDVSWLYNLNPVSFNYRQQDETFAYTNEVVNETEYGLIADEVEQVNADLCFYAVDEEGNQTLAGVSYRKLIPVLTKAIQEQQTIIDSQVSAIADLTTRLEALEAN